MNDFLNSENFLKIGSRVRKAVKGAPLFVDQNDKLAQSLNVVEVNTMADFPDPVAGVITLESKAYNINAHLSSSDRFNIPDGITPVFQGRDATISSFTYTGTGVAFTGEDVVFVATQILFSATNAAGTLFDFTPASPSTGGVFLDIVTLMDVANFGTISNLASFSTVNSAYIDIGTGMVFSDIGVINIHQVQMLDWKNQSTSMLSINGANTTSIINTSSFTPESNESVFDIDAASTITNGAVSGNVVNIEEGGSAFATGSKDQTDKFWKFEGNTNIPDSDSTAGLSLSGNATNTTFAAVNTPTLVLGTWVVDQTERFVGTTAGRATYIGLEEISLQVIANPTSVTGVGTNKDVSFYFAHGNETDHAITAYADGGVVTTTVTSAGHGLSNGDRVFQRNSTNYNGLFTISNVTTDTYDIPITFVGDDAAGDWVLILETSRASNQLGSTTKASNTTVLDRQIFCTNDYVELFIENNTGATSLLVKNANITVGT